MRSSLTRFVGSAEYCYANSASMLLASIDEVVDPSLVESMTAVGAGARLWRDDGMIYFSILPPDIGLTRAFRALGFEVHEQAFEAGSPIPVEVLRAEVSLGPVLVGPLDMQYRPTCQVMSPLAAWTITFSSQVSKNLIAYDCTTRRVIQISVWRLAIWRRHGGPLE